MNKIIITGYSGFLCKNILPLFDQQRFEIIPLDVVVGYKVDISTPFDLTTQEPYDTIIHTAGKAHSIPISDKEKEAFLRVNFEGTKNLCKALERAGASPSNFIYISSVAVYGIDQGEDISEDTPLYGTSAYAISKIKAENWLKGWAEKNKVNLLIFRLPLVAGLNPPGNLGAMVRAMKAGYYFRIGSGSARKSIVLASDVAKIIQKSLGKSGTYNLTDGYHPSFSELEDLIASQLNRKILPSIPLKMVRLLARIGDIIGNKFPLNSSQLRKITSTLTFNDEKARKELDWKPNRVVDNFKIC